MKGRLVLLLLLVVVGFALVNGFGLLFRLSYVLAGVLVLSYFWARANLWGVEVTADRKTERAQVGQWVETSLAVRNKGRLPKLWLEVRDNSDLPDYSPATVVTLLGGGQQRFKATGECKKRGRFTLGPVTIASGDPFGLFIQQCNLGSTHHLLVYPTTVDLPHFTIPTASLAGEGRFRRRTHYVTPNAAGVRDWVPGDSFNRIHWPSTAHTGRLMVKEFELDPSSEIWVLLDLDSRVQAGEGLESTEEYGVTCAASIAKRYIDVNRSVGFMAYGEQWDVLRVDRGNSQLWRMLELLALAKAQGTVPLAEVIAAQGRRFGRHTTVVVITPSSDEEWVTALRHLTRRGVRASVVLLEATTFGGANNTLQVVASLAGGGIPTYLVKKGQAIAKAMASPIEAGFDRVGGIR